MTTRKKHNAVNRPAMTAGAAIAGTASWIADELIGIWTLERSLSKRLESRTPQNQKALLNHIQDLNRRIDLLDRALDEYVWTGSAA
jgi:hypothetical protein